LQKIKISLHDSVTSHAVLKSKVKMTRSREVQAWIVL